ncbi:RAM signaling pathway protein-domain-containing protein [Sordaria brevicollis]|uniref:RAM signaling pathway protein-domain-containing protein n=1 Tax=Sordaria brevicollis TaxID=83679 RepID=A0AAE0NWH0_SORBR|nr:RAM signaling pathway protein-domain-containing protein [Sordaria brevicollis]
MMADTTAIATERALSLSAEAQQHAGPNSTRRHGLGETSNSDGDVNLNEHPRAHKPMERRGTGNGRFPIRVNGSSVSSTSTTTSTGTVVSPADSKPPPIPQRSHFRGVSQSPSLVNKKPGLIPLALQRSKGAGLRSSSVPPRTSDSLKPNGAQATQTRLARAMSSAEEGRPGMDSAGNVITSGSRGSISSHSHGANRYGHNPVFTNPFRQETVTLGRTSSVWELSVLPVRRNSSQDREPLVEVARGVLYSISQVHSAVQSMSNFVVNHGTGSKLETTFERASFHFHELEQAIHALGLPNGTHGDERLKYRALQQALSSLISAYIQICSELTGHVDMFVDNGDGRYLRTFLMLIYHSVMELRSTLNGLLSAASKEQPSPVHGFDAAATIRPRRRTQGSTTPTPSRPSSIRNHSPLPSFKGRKPPGGLESARGGVNMQVRTDIPYPGPGGAPTRTVAVATAGSAPAATSAKSTGITTASTLVATPDIPPMPRTPEPRPTASSFFSSPTPSHMSSNAAADSTEAPFDVLFLTLKSATSQVLHTLPPLNSLFAHYHHQVHASPAMWEASKAWTILLTSGVKVQKQTEALRERLSTLRVGDPALFSPPRAAQPQNGSGHGSASASFWDVCEGLYTAWAEFGDLLKTVLVRSTDSAAEGMKTETKEEINPKLSLPLETLKQLGKISRGLRDAAELSVVVKKQIQVQQQQQQQQQQQAQQAQPAAPTVAMSQGQNKIMVRMRERERQRERSISPRTRDISGTIRAGTPAARRLQQMQMEMQSLPPLPMTPQSAALGPAFRATKPSPFGSFSG